MAETRTPDLFDRLLARAGAVSRPDTVVPLARPRLAMPFEQLSAAPLTETEVEIDATAPSRPVVRALAAPPATAQAGPQGASAPRPPVLSRIERAVRSIDTVRTVSAGPSGVAQAAASAVLRSVVERLVPSHAVARAVEEPAYRGPVADTPARTPSLGPMTAGRTASAALPSVPRTDVGVRRLEAQATQAEPSVQVSIGRLEVTTAAHEPKRERTGRTGRPEPAVGLEAFLDRQEAT
ncbi:hypothetical protein [Streptomyces paludis]|uniref:Uncharacterized protein n=1 Tax=Streptomyces paludis TaxID=2282738 RepID=A0A345HYW0_9ACTN|nr:hypothetical protein [Streptomyces paludis]AXG81884.1 hypothetical protein DVK44_33820 [Streptomyces paludis]